MPQAKSSSKLTPWELTMKEALCKGVGVETIKAFAAEALSQPELLNTLLAALKGELSVDPFVLRKSAWVLHHVYLMDNRALLLKRDQLSDILDATTDVSVLRELLKILASPVWVDIESESQRREMVALGTDLLHDTSVPIALHYAAMQLIGFRIQTKKELDECLEAMQYLGVELGVQNTAFLSCLQRTAVSFRQNFARIKLPN